MKRSPEAAELLHKLRTADTPKFGPAAERRPMLANEAGAQVASLHPFREGFVYRAAGAVAPGIYLEGADGARRLLLPDTKGHRLLSCRPAGRFVAALAARQNSAPGRPDAIVFVNPEDGMPEGLSGQALAISGNAKVAVVADLEEGRLVRLDLETLVGVDVADIAFDSSAHPVPMISVDETGTRAWVMEASGGRVSLIEVDLTHGTKTPVVEGLPEPSWVLGKRLPSEGLIVLEMVHDAASRFRVLRFDAGKPPTTLLELAHGQPAVAPVRIKPGWLGLVLSLTPHALAGYGPTDVVALSTGGGARVPLTDRGDVQGTLRRTAHGLLVEGGERLLELSHR